MKNTRFDFNHFEPLTAQQIEELEDIINQAILANMPINCEQMAIEKAKETGAMAFFGDKYGDVVRIVSMGNFSKEFCGGTHCKATGDIGCIKILGESGIGSGLRRIECLTDLELSIILENRNTK